MYSDIAHAQRWVASLVVGQRLPGNVWRWVRGRSGLGPPWVRASNAVVASWVQGAGLPRARTPARVRTRDKHTAPLHPPYVRVFAWTTRTQCRLARNDGKKWVQAYPDPTAIQSDPRRTRASSGWSGAGGRLTAMPSPARCGRSAVKGRAARRVLLGPLPCGHRKSQFFRRRAGCRIGSQVGGLGCAADVIHRHMGRGHG